MVNVPISSPCGTLLFQTGTDSEEWVLAVSNKKFGCNIGWQIKAVLNYVSINAIRLKTTKKDENRLKFHFQ
jgi:hypothetical protein